MDHQIRLEAPPSAGANCREPIERNSDAGDVKEASDGEGQRHRGHQKNDERAKQLPPSEFRQQPRSRRARHGAPHDQSDPPGSDHTPAEGEEGWVFGVEDVGMADGEVFEANTGRDQVVEDAVDERRETIAMATILGDSRGFTALAGQPLRHPDDAT